MYKKFLFIICYLFLSSCISQETKDNIKQKLNIQKTLKTAETKTEQIIDETNKDNINESVYALNKTIHVVLSDDHQHKYTSQSFLNALELAVFSFENSSLTFEISFYKNKQDLNDIFVENSKPGTLFIGPLTSTDTKQVEQFCEKNILIFSFASDKALAKNCIYLFNFFIEDDLKAIFSYFDMTNRVALIYPDNEYGKYVNDIIQKYANNGESTLIYRLAYKEDLSNARDVIRKLGKYDYRKSELEKQKKILKDKNDEVSLASLKKLEKFETIGDLDFNTLIISDGNLRILELVPLLPFYDIDPNQIQFVGTGLWDEKSFFDEPSLQKAIFPGAEIAKRKNFIDNYIKLFDLPPPRINTVMYDLASLVNFLTTEYDDLYSIKSLLDSDNLFNGLDGQFSILNNSIQRNLSILQINEGEAHLVK